MVVTLTGSTPKFSTPEVRTVHGSLFFDAQIISGWSFGDLVTWYFWCFFLEGWNVHPRMHLFIQVTTHLNSSLSLWISWWANAPRLKTKSSTVNLSWWRDQIKKRQTCTDSSLLQKKTGAKTPKKKLPETLKRSDRKSISSEHQGARVLSCWCKYLKASEISRKTLILPTTRRMDIGEWLIGNSILNSSRNERVTSLKSQSFQCCGRINISNGSVTASQWPYLYCYRKVRRACITLDGMRLCFYPILSKSWALTKAIVTNRDPGMTKPELNYKPKKNTNNFLDLIFQGYIYSWNISQRNHRYIHIFHLYIYICIYLKIPCFKGKIPM